MKSFTLSNVLSDSKDDKLVDGRFCLCFSLLMAKFTWRARSFNSFLSASSRIFSVLSSNILLRSLILCGMIRSLRHRKLNLKWLRCEAIFLDVLSKDLT